MTVADRRRQGTTGADQAAAAAALLERDPAAALAAARGASGHPRAALVEGQALRRLGQPAAAAAVLRALAGREPRFTDARWEWAQAASEAGDSRQAVAALEQLMQQRPGLLAGWRLLAAELRRLGAEAPAWRADQAGIQVASRDPDLIRAALAMNEGRLDEAAAALDARLAREADDAAATRLLGEVRWRQGDMTAALAAIERAVVLAPGFDLAREFLVRLLLQTNRLADARHHAERLCASPGPDRGYDLVRASVLVAMGDQAGARDIYRALLAARADQPQIWQNLGHVLKTLGQQAEAVEAYREAVTRQPTMGEAWWSLANLKTVRLDAADVAAMTAALAQVGGDAAERTDDLFHLHFALGKALEDQGAFARSFDHYREGNRRRRALLRYDADDLAAETAATSAALTPAFMATRADGGCPASDPIFVVGLPRSGSTLVEQILASHSRIEGTMELPEMMMIAGRLSARVDEGEFADWGAMIAALGPDDRRRLGEEYLERTRVHRHTDRPFFIDKMPNNWQHVGLITLILPQATIIDVRRHPVSCCFSGWKQHFARGQAFSYDLVEIGRYYRDYVAAMTAFDAARPGAVHRVVYERLVADTETEVRRLLAHVGVAFEPACLEFYKNDRAVRTPSSEQVRRPIFTDGLEQWRHYEPWLAPLIDTLGAVTRTYADPVPRLDG